jgi:hypothetical protein
LKSSKDVYGFEKKVFVRNSRQLNASKLTRLYLNPFWYRTVDQGGAVHESPGLDHFLTETALKYADPVEGRLNATGFRQHVQSVVVDNGEVRRELFAYCDGAESESTICFRRHSLMVIIAHFLRKDTINFVPERKCWAGGIFATTEQHLGVFSQSILF